MAARRRICIIRCCGTSGRRFKSSVSSERRAIVRSRDAVLHPYLPRYLLHARSQRSGRRGGRRHGYHQRRGRPHQLGRKEGVLHLIKTGPLTLMSSLGHRAVFGAGAWGRGVGGGVCGGLTEGIRAGSGSLLVRVEGSRSRRETGVLKKGLVLSRCLV